MPALSTLTNTAVLSGTDEFYVLDGANSRAATWTVILDQIQSQVAVPTSVSSAYRTSTILSSTSTGEGAALIGSEDAGTYFTATTVEGILQEIGAALPTGTIVGTSDTQALTNKTLTAPRVNQLNDTNGNESITLTATASGVSYLDVASGTTGNDVVLTGSGETNTGISIQASGTGNVSVGPIVIDGDAAVGAGQDNYVLTYNHSAGTWGPEPTGGGDVSIAGTPADNYLAVWTSASAIEGDANLQWNGSTLDITGDIVLTERADHAFTPSAGHGILWSRSDTPNVLVFTDDTGADNDVLTAGSGTTLTDEVIATNDKIPFFDVSDSDNPKTCNDLIGDLSLAVTTGDTWTGVHDFGGATSLEIPNGTTPTVNAAGEIALDTSVVDWSHGIIKYHDGTEELAVVALPVADLTTPTGGNVISYNATDDEFELVALAGGGDMLAATYDPAAIGEQLVGLTAAQTLTNKTLTSPVLTTPQINDTSADHQYVFAVSELAADRTVTLPLLTGNDTFVFNDHTATLTNKTIDSASNTLTVDLAEATVTGTTAQFNTALSDGSFATLAGTETLTNKTVNLTSNTLSGTLAQFNTALSDGNFTGQQHLYIPAAAMIARTTSGAAAGSTELATNDVMVESFDFDTAADEHVQFSLQMPKNWNEGTLVAQFIWSHPSTTTNFGVTWAIQAVAFADGDAGDTAFGTAVLVDDTGGTTDDIYISPESGAITVAGTPGAEEYVVFQIYRDVSDANDTLAVDARLHGVKIHWTSDAITAD